MSGSIGGPEPLVASMMVTPGPEPARVQRFRLPPGPTVVGTIIGGLLLLAVGVVVGVLLFGASL